MAVCATVIFSVPGAASAQKKTPAKPAPTQTGRPYVLGTKQLPGEFGKLGTTYTLGSASPLNVTLLRAEYTTDRIVNDRGFDGQGLTGILPNKSEKWLVLHYSVQNPKSTEVRVFDRSLRINAVDAADKNYEIGSAIVREANSSAAGSPYPVGGQFDATLKPAQKVFLMCALRVPAQGEIPKLIIARGDDEGAAVVRYDLRGKVAKLPASVAADASGVSAKDSFTAETGKYYPWQTFDVRVDSVAFSSDQLFGSAPENGGRYLVVKLTTKGVGKPSRLSGYLFDAKLKTADGESLTPFNPSGGASLFLPSRDEPLDAESEVGAERSARMVFVVPPGADIKTLSLAPTGEGEAFRPYVFDMSGVKP